MKCNDCGEKEKLEPTLLGEVYVYKCLVCGSPDIVEDKEELNKIKNDRQNN